MALSGGPTRGFKTLLKKGRSFNFADAGRWTLYFVLIGIIVGLGSIVFHYLTQIGLHYFLDFLAGYRPPAPAGEHHLLAPTATPFNRWMFLFLPSLGGLVSGWIVYTFAPEAEGPGTDAAIKAYHNDGGFIRGRIPIVKTIASALTLTSGGSGGREGPIAQIGAGFGSFLSHQTQTDGSRATDHDGRGCRRRDRQHLQGSAGRSALRCGGLYREPEFESEVIIPAGVSSVVAYCLFCLQFGWGSLFQSPDFHFRNPLELGPYIVLAFVLVGLGIFYVKAFYGTVALFKKINIPNHLKPALGGLMTGIIGFFLPQTLAFGYGYAQMALQDQLTIPFLLFLAVGKVLTTSFSIGSGGSGGVFGPSVVIGGAMGGVVGKTFHLFMPTVVTEPGAFVVVGMAGFFTAVSNTPISTIIFVSEMTNSYHLLLPSLAVCSVCYLAARKWTIYCRQVKSRVDSPAHAGEFFVDILQSIRVHDLMDQVKKVRLIPQDMTFSDFKNYFSRTDQHYFPVMDQDQRLVSIFSINDVRGVLFSQEIEELVVMKDIGTSTIIFATPSEDLNSVMQKFTIRNIDSLPVVTDDDHGILIGMLGRRAVISFYNHQIQGIKRSHQHSGEPASEVD